MKSSYCLVFVVLFQYEKTELYKHKEIKAQNLPQILPEAEPGDHIQ